MSRFFVVVSIWMVAAGQWWLPARVHSPSPIFITQERVWPFSDAKVRDIAFNFNDKLFPFKNKKFVVVVRFSKTTGEPDSQIILTRFDDNRTEVLIEQMQRSVGGYFPRDVPEESLTDEQLAIIARDIRIERTVLRNPTETVEQLLSQFLELKYSPLPNKGIRFDGTEYDLWYVVPEQTIHITQHGPTVGFKGTAGQPVQWMNEVYSALNLKDSVWSNRQK